MNHDKVSDKLASSGIPPNRCIFSCTKVFFSNSPYLKKNIYLRVASHEFLLIYLIFIFASCFRNCAHITRLPHRILSCNEIITALRSAATVDYSSTFPSVTRYVQVAACNMYETCPTILPSSLHCKTQENCPVEQHLNLTCYYFLKGIFVGSSSSSSIGSPDYYNDYHTSSPGVTCSWKISTANGYILQLTFDKMSISSCSGCSCGYLEVRDGSTSGDPILGRYCNENRPSLVLSKGSEMFVKYYGQYRFDSFRTT